ncbi:MAG: biotin/lipoyl-binding protein [Candidatus Velthaea sp.]|jgi:acetyl-CoA carboxylase biotin carboxyl carrier protein
MTDDTIVARVRALAEAFTVTGLARATIKDADFELELRRSRPYIPPASPDSPAVAPVAVEETLAAKPDIVSSDLVGVVRFSRPQVNEGHRLDSDRELAFVEALGIRNPVRSRGPGRIAAVFVTDGQPVEYGQPLFAIER